MSFPGPAKTWNYEGLSQKQQHLRDALTTSPWADYEALGYQRVEMLARRQRKLQLKLLKRQLQEICEHYNKIWTSKIKFFPWKDKC